MNTPLSPSIRGSARGSPGSTNCGRNAKKKIVSFGLRILISTPRTITLTSGQLAVTDSLTILGPGTGLLTSRHFPDEFQGNFLNCNVISFQGIYRVKVTRDPEWQEMGEEEVS